MRKSPPPPSPTAQPANGTRVTVTLPSPDHVAVQNLARKKKVSVAWIVRDAVEKYIQQEAGAQT